MTNSTSTSSSISSSFTNNTISWADKARSNLNLSKNSNHQQNQNISNSSSNSSSTSTHSSSIVNNSSINPNQSIIQDHSINLPDISSLTLISQINPSNLNSNSSTQNDLKIISIQNSSKNLKNLNTTSINSSNSSNNSNHSKSKFKSKSLNHNQNSITIHQSDHLKSSENISNSSNLKSSSNPTSNSNLNVWQLRKVELSKKYQINTSSSDLDPSHLNQTHLHPNPSNLHQINQSITLINPIIKSSSDLHPHSISSQSHPLNHQSQSNQSQNFLNDSSNWPAPNDENLKLKSTSNQSIDQINHLVHQIKSENFQIKSNQSNHQSNHHSDQSNHQSNQSNHSNHQSDQSEPTKKSNPNSKKIQWKPIQANITHNAPLPTNHPASIRANKQNRKDHHHHHHHQSRSNQPSKHPSSNHGNSKLNKSSNQSGSDKSPRSFNESSSNEKNKSKSSSNRQTNHKWSNLDDRKSLDQNLHSYINPIYQSSHHHPSINSDQHQLLSNFLSPPNNPTNLSSLPTIQPLQNDKPGFIPRISPTIKPPIMELSAGPTNSYLSNLHSNFSLPDPSIPTPSINNSHLNHPIDKKFTTNQINSSQIDLHVNAPQGNVWVSDPLVMSDGKNPVPSASQNNSQSAALALDSCILDPPPSSHPESSHPSSKSFHQNHILSNQPNSITQINSNQQSSDQLPSIIQSSHTDSQNFQTQKLPLTLQSPISKSNPLNSDLYQIERDNRSTKRSNHNSNSSSNRSPRKFRNHESNEIIDSRHSNHNKSLINSNHHLSSSFNPNSSSFSNLSPTHSGSRDHFQRKSISANSNSKNFHHFGRLGNGSGKNQNRHHSWRNHNNHNHNHLSGGIKNKTNPISHDRGNSSSHHSSRSQTTLIRSLDDYNPKWFPPSISQDNNYPIGLTYNQYRIGTDYSHHPHPPPLSHNLHHHHHHHHHHQQQQQQPFHSHLYHSQPYGSIKSDTSHPNTDGAIQNSNNLSPSTVNSIGNINGSGILSSNDSNTIGNPPYPSNQPPRLFIAQSPTSITNFEHGNSGSYQSNISTLDHHSGYPPFEPTSNHYGNQPYYPPQYYYPPPPHSSSTLPPPLPSNNSQPGLNDSTPYIVSPPSTSLGEITNHHPINLPPPPPQPSLSNLYDHPYYSSHSTNMFDYSHPIDPVRYYVLGQCEYYFSTENLMKDMFLRTCMNQEGWVKIDMICRFNRIKALTTDVNLVTDVMKTSALLEVNDEIMVVRRRGDWADWVLTKYQNHSLNETSQETKENELINQIHQSVLKEESLDKSSTIIDTFNQKTTSSNSVIESDGHDADEEDFNSSTALSRNALTQTEDGVYHDDQKKIKKNDEQEKQEPDKIKLNGSPINKDPLEIEKEHIMTGMTVVPGTTKKPGGQPTISIGFDPNLVNRNGNKNGGRSLQSSSTASGLSKKSR